MREVYAELSGTDHAVTGEHVIIRADVHNTRAVESQVMSLDNMDTSAVIVSESFLLFSYPCTQMHTCSLALDIPALTYDLYSLNTSLNRCKSLLNPTSAIRVLWLVPMERL